MIDMRRPAHVVEVLRHQVSRIPGHDAVLFVGDPEDDSTVRTWSYAELDRHARRIASWLAAKFPAGERVLLAYPLGVDFAAAFFGCLYAGMIAVPVPLPGRYRHQRERLRSIARSSAARMVLTDSDSLAEVADWAAEQLGDAGLAAATDDESAGDADAWTRPPITSDTVALLQFTSGSTSEPKGVMISHGNLLRNIATLDDTFPVSAFRRRGGWIPAYHDMGLMGILLPGVLLGSSAVLMNPTTFIKRPHKWLRLVDKFDIGFSAAPNFAYELCTSRITDDQLDGVDLSRWQYACSGSEPVRAATLRGFAERFARHGLANEAVIACYGLAEATVFVSGTGNRPAPVCRVDAELLAQNVFRPVGEEPGRDLVGCGAVRDLDVRIVRPETGQVLEDGEVGEIWLRGGCVSSGYWQEELATATAFGAVTAEGESGFLRTGDLGVVHDAELYVTGRIKETLVLRGRNLYPQDIEHELRVQHEGLGAVGAVFTVALPAGDEEALVVLHEVKTRHKAGFAELTVGMRQTVAREFGVQAAGVALLRPGAVRRTTSGKIQRAEMRRLFVDGLLEPLHADLDTGLVRQGVAG